MDCKNTQDVLQACSNVLEISDKDVKVLESGKFQSPLIDQLVWNAVFSPDEAAKKLCCWIIRCAAQAQGAYPASIQPLYEAMGREEVEGFTVPAINIRGLTYDVARTIFQQVRELNTFPFVFEIARSEMEYTEQRPLEYVTVILAAAVKEGYTGPVFIQGDHFQMKAKTYAEDPEREAQGIKDLINEAVGAGFYNIDVDTSTLVDLSHPTIPEQQKLNFEECARFTNYIREIEPKGVTISVGGEIGEVGKSNTTVEEFEAFMKGYESCLNKGAKGISKISIQTGTSHGGIPLPDGSIAKVNLDFGTLEKISKEAREQFKMAGAVQHGASTLPDELFDKFPKAQTCEIHLATGFQNMIYDHASFPKKMTDEIYSYLKEKCAGERKDKDTEEQFLYKTRKKGFGPFKKQMWSLPEKTRNSINKTLGEKFKYLFEKLNVAGKRPALEKPFSSSTIITPQKPC